MKRNREEDCPAKPDGRGLCSCCVSRECGSSVVEQGTGINQEVGLQMSDVIMDMTHIEQGAVIPPECAASIVESQRCTYIANALRAEKMELIHPTSFLDVA